jgi:hypothetical protein
MYYGRGVLAVHYCMTYHLGKLSITTFGISSVWEGGRKFTHNYDNKCEKAWRKQITQQRASSISLT